MRFRPIFFVILSVFTSPLLAKSLTMPETDRQQIKYWLPYIVSEKNTDAINAQQVFSRLLKTWDQSRVEPELVIVKTNDGPWAASLADGHILINTSALKAVKSIQPKYHQDALAFILAHELSHQKNDDLWHQRFFRFNKQKKQTFLSDGIKDRRLKEIQADQDGLTMMTVVGFNPGSITRGKGFFTAWLEINRQYDCAEDRPQSLCAFAKQRANNAKRQIMQIIQQKTWYDLGLFLLANNKFEKSRQYFLTFAKDFPHWMIYNTIAVSYLLEVMPNIKNKNYYLSLQQLQLDKLSQTVAKRSASTKKEVKNLLKRAIHYLNKSDHLQPENPQTYYLLSLSYVIDSNIPMAKGILEGKLINKKNMTSEMFYLRAIIDEKQQNFSLAEQNLISAKSLSGNNRYLNFAILEQQLLINRQNAKGQQKLNTFVEDQIKNGDSIGFRWGLNGIKPQQKLINNDFFFEWPPMKESAITNKTLWLQGEPYKHINNANFHYLAYQRNPIYRWCIQPGCFMDKTLDSKERLLTTYGYPQRIQHLAGFDYMIYREAGFIAMLNDQQIEKIFQISNE